MTPENKVIYLSEKISLSKALTVQQAARIAELEAQVKQEFSAVAHIGAVAEQELTALRDQLTRLTADHATVTAVIAANDAKEIERAGNPFDSPQFELRSQLLAAKESLATVTKQLAESAFHVQRLRQLCDKGDGAIAEIENIGQLTGCDHTEGLSRCVREMVEAAEARATKAEAALAEALDWVLALETCMHRLLSHANEVHKFYSWTGMIEYLDVRDSRAEAEELLRAARLSPATDAKGKEKGA